MNSGLNPGRTKCRGKPICIIGMHRSGTSMVARILSFCGLDLGSPNQSTPPSTSNPLGHFEDQVIVYRINDSLLAHLGGSWDEPPIFIQGWETNPSLKKYFQAARSHISTRSISSRWGWKDPRTTILLPFWKTIINDLRFVICIRKPLHVAESLQRRNELSVSKGLSLWNQYVIAAIGDSKGCPRIFTFYEDYFTDAHREIERLVEFCELPTSRVMAGSCNAIFHELNHTAKSDRSLIENELLAETNHLYEQLHSEKAHLLEGKTPNINHNISVQHTNVDQSANEQNAISKYNLIFPRFKIPLVSIVIPTCNGVEYLSSCLRSVLHYTNISYELIVVDDCSNDATYRLLDRLENVKVIRNRVNQDFLIRSNSGAASAEGQYIMFLKNDVTVRRDWLSMLVDTVERYPRCGAVGAKLIGMDGKLQEAGAIVWRDGTAVPYGSGDDPFKPEYCYIREVDYCSAACLLVRSDLFRQLGGFNELYTPACYEDPDLCFAIRQLGYKVVLQPEVTIFHHGAGSRPLLEAEALCCTNRPKFTEKWLATLAQRSPKNDSIRARDCRLGQRVLVLDERIPSVYEDSGACYPYKLLFALVDLEFIVTFLPIFDRQQHKSAALELQQLGIEVFYGGSFDPEHVLQAREGYYHIIIVREPFEGGDYDNLIHKYFPDARVIATNDFDSQDLDSLKVFILLSQDRNTMEAN